MASEAKKSIKLTLDVRSQIQNGTNLFCWKLGQMRSVGDVNPTLQSLHDLMTIKVQESVDRELRINRLKN